MLFSQMTVVWSKLLVHGLLLSSANCCSATRNAMVVYVHDSLMWLIQRILPHT